MTSTPILFLSDSPTVQSGFGRIGRELACRLAQHPEFRVGYMGRGGLASRKFPFPQYPFPESEQWGERLLEHVWRDFAGKEQGIIFTIWDVSRLLWFARPELSMPAQSHTASIGLSDGLKRLLQSDKVFKWGYFPVDSVGPSGKLTYMSAETLRGYDRILAYGSWGADVIEKTIGLRPDWIPHGMDLERFQPRPKTAARMAMGMPQDAFVVGMVGTNQVRKDWGCAASAMAILRRKVPDLRWWIHIDVLERHWSINALLHDFGLTDCTRVTLTGSMNDEQLSYWYSGCDVTILPSSEGFGYPIVESMACGVPCIHSRYGGGSELVGDTTAEVPLFPSMRPTSFRLDTPSNCLRPVLDPENLSEIILICRDYLENPTWKQQVRSQVEHLAWDKLWPSTWAKWFLEGVQ